MRFCKKCVMPDTRPGICFDEEGVCQACRAEEVKNSINWDERWKELECLCDKHRGQYGKNAYDCIIAVSGGKDSHYQVHVFKELLGMNPLLISVEDNFTMTEAGKHNIKNISEVFGCNIISLKPDIRTQKSLMRLCFEKWAKPTWFVDRLIYTYPVRMALAFGISLVVYGENVAYEYGGISRQEKPSAAEQIFNGVAADIPYEELLHGGLTARDLTLCEYPIAPHHDFVLEPIYLSYFVRWNSFKNYIFAKSIGFRDLTHEWQREHTPECFDQVDSMAYLVHPWLKYPKFGHATGTDYASRFIRYGLISREQGIAMVKKYDHRLDQKAVDDFCQFTGYSLREFYTIIDRFYNRELFVKDCFGMWVLKHPVWEES